MVIEIKQTFSFFVPKLVLLNQEPWELWGPCVWTSQKRPLATGASDRTQAQEAPNKLRAGDGQVALVA